ncbi:hypothetical protein DPEC_G00017520 [Dallia pectoralis]|uniref:Uncharacterized protein n=1 Tax=Dallia pectoralis TaxID=75939 RepID=A0ACC2HF45_DALPE|nr:hypothetical protein DPEC_G00017520 [Dallia pectoralis]
MDPVDLIPGQKMDTHQLHQALAHQGALIGHHSQALYKHRLTLRQLLQTVSSSRPSAPQFREPRVPAAERNTISHLLTEKPMHLGQAQPLRSGAHTENASGSLSLLWSERPLHHPNAAFGQKRRLASDIGSSGEPSPFSLYTSTSPLGRME